jgi:hypothetical protein
MLHLGVGFNWRVQVLGIFGVILGHGIYEKIMLVVTC